MQQISVIACLAAGAVIIFLWTIGAYGKIARLKARSDDAWVGVDVQYSRRYDLFRDIIAASKDVPQEILDEAAEARRAVNMAMDPERRIFAENRFTAAFAKVMAANDASDDSALAALTAHLPESDLDTRAARRCYNVATQDFNEEIERFPSSIVASIFRFAPAPYFNYSDDR